MRDPLWCTAAAILILGLAGGTYAAASKAAPDQTPLLFDRVRAFDAVVVATLADGFEKQTKPVPSSNCVRLSARIGKALKGTLKPGTAMDIHCHEQLPGLLAERDRTTPRRYLLVLKISGPDGYGYLGSANLYGDLERCFPADESLEAVAAAFMAAKKTAPGDLLALCVQLLGDPALSESGGSHVNGLLVRAIGLCRTGEPTRKDADAALASVIGRMTRGLNVATGARVLDAYKQAGFDVAGRPGAAKAGEALAAWLKREIGVPARAFSPDYLKAGTVECAARVLGILKVGGAGEVLVQLAKTPRWPAARPVAVWALTQALGAKAEAPLRDLLKEFDRAGSERFYNATADALREIGRGAGLENKPLPMTLAPPPVF